MQIVHELIAEKKSVNLHHWLKAHEVILALLHGGAHRLLALVRLDQLVLQRGTVEKQLGSHKKQQDELAGLQFWPAVGPPAQRRQSRLSTSRVCATTATTEESWWWRWRRWWG